MAKFAIAFLVGLIFSLCIWFIPPINKLIISLMTQYPQQFDIYWPLIIILLFVIIIALFDFGKDKNKYEYIQMLKNIEQAEFFILREDNRDSNQLKTMHYISSNLIGLSNVSSLYRKHKKLLTLVQSNSNEDALKTLNIIKYRLSKKI